MPQQRYRFTIRLSLEAPILSQASGAIRFGFDNAMQRDANGHPVLPGTLVRGHLRHACDEFDELGAGPGAKAVTRWLGQPSSSGDEPARGQLEFGRYWTSDTQGTVTTARTRIKIDPDIGAAETGAIQVIDSPWPSGTTVRFSGAVHAWLEPGAEHDLANWLRRALWYTPALGALKGIGFGRVTAVEVEPERIEPPEPKHLKLKDKTTQRPWSLGLTLRPHDAFCFSRHRQGNNETYNRIERKPGEFKDGVSNHYVSEDFIPGGAIKGAIASLLRDLGGQRDPRKPPSHPGYPQLCKHLDAITVTHAQPVLDSTAGQARPPAIPLSLISYREPDQDDDSERDTRLYDLLRHTTPDRPAALLNGEAPLFNSDWKRSHWQLAAGAMHHNADLSHSLQVRTAIERETNAARESALFSYRCVEPDGHRWLADVGLPPDLDQHGAQHLVNELQTLLAHGLHRLGKTAVGSDAELQLEPHRERPKDSLRNGQAIVTLNSAARLLDLEALAINPSNGGADLLSAYRDAWTALSGGSLTLVNFYASQTLVGGAYWWHRFRQRVAPYNPELHTDTGSSFLLEPVPGREADAIACLQCWFDRGLPQLPGAPGGDDWQHNPWIAANGYGEVCINHDIHWQGLPAGDRLDLLKPLHGEETEQ